jgi:hypothetical protein
MIETSYVDCPVCGLIQSTEIGWHNHLETFECDECGAILQVALEKYYDEELEEEVVVFRFEEFDFEDHDD